MSEKVSNGIRKLYKCVSNSLGEMLIPQDIKRILGGQMKQLNTSRDNYIRGQIEVASEDTNAMEDIRDLYDRTCNRMLWQEMKKQKNIESVINKTKELLESEANISEQDVDEDWMSRFFSSIQDISNEKMQLLWSKILAGEIKKPRTFSMRLLDCMTKISKDEAQLFEKYSLHMLNIGSKIAIIRNDEFEKKHDISYDDILILKECNLIESSPFLSINFLPDVQDEAFCIIRYNGQCITIEMAKGKEFSLPVYQLTRLGTELFQVVKVKYDTNYLSDVAQYIAKNNKDKTVLLYKTYVLVGNNIFPVGEPDKIVSE